MPNRVFYFILLLLFAFRTFQGTVFFSNVDAFQIYLIGLKFYTTGVYPYWGPDVIYNASQIPGGLQGLLVGLPFFIWPVPESPFIALNLITFASIGCFAWYLSRRMPEIPRWFAWIWLLTAPWALRYSTLIENPSYVVPAAMLFFIAVFELFPFYRDKLIRPQWAFFILGCCPVWVMQVHMSWVLMMPYIAAAFYFNRHDRALILKGLAFFAAGAVVMAIPLLPTLLRFGSLASGGTEQNIAFNAQNLLHLPLIAARFVSFGCNEMVRFIGNHTAERLAFLKTYWWAAPAFVVMTVAGIAQLVWLVYSAFRPLPFSEWKAVRWFAGGSVLLVYVAFLFSKVYPFSHAFIMMYPVAMWYSFYCYRQLAGKKWFKPTAAVFLALGALCQVVIAWENNKHDGMEIWHPKIERALAERDYTRLGLRREAFFEAPHTEDIWDRNPDSLVFSTGYEYQYPWFKPQNIVRTTALNGTFSCKIDSLQAYGLSFSCPVADLKGHRKAHVSFFIRVNQPQVLTLVTDVKQGTERVFWKGTPILVASLPLYVWREIQADIELPEQCPERSVVSVYLWNRLAAESEAAFVDQVRIDFGSARQSRALGAGERELDR
jgi:hypothetical protein